VAVPAATSSTKPPGELRPISETVTNLRPHDMPHESVPLIELLQYTIESVRLLLFSIANWQVMVIFPRQRNVHVSRRTGVARGLEGAPAAGRRRCAVEREGTRGATRRRRRAASSHGVRHTRAPRGGAGAGRPGTITVTSTTLIHKDKRSLHTTWNTSIAMIFSRSLTSGLSGMYGWKDSERPFQAPGP
jgi:hypothetical protein